jgi:hypothetical protein
MQCSCARRALITPAGDRGSSRLVRVGIRGEGADNDTLASASLSVLPKFWSAMIRAALEDVLHVPRYSQRRLFDELLNDFAHPLGCDRYFAAMKGCHSPCDPEPFDGSQCERLRPSSNGKAGWCNAVPKAMTDQAGDRHCIRLNYRSARDPGCFHCMLEENARAIGFGAEN